MNDFQNLAQANSASDLYENLASGVAGLMVVSSVHVMPFTPPSDGRPGSVLRHRDKDPNEILEKIYPALTALQSLPSLPVLFDQPRCMMRVEEVFGWDRWLRMPVYQEFFRPSDSARQLVVGLRSAAGTPLAFMAVCRAETDEMMTQSEERLVLDWRDTAERALRAFDVNSDWSQPAESILAAITAALPVPALLLDTEGRILWMNREAELRLEAVALTFGSDRFYARGSRALEQLIAHARHELRESGASVSPRSDAAAFDWLLPGESVVVRRLEQAGAPLRALVCISVAPTLPLAFALDDLRRAHRLSARETDVALLALEGFNVLSIACRLNVAESTVCSHLKRVYRKLGVCSRAELAWRIMRS